MTKHERKLIQKRRYRGTVVGAMLCFALYLCIAIVLFEGARL